MAVARLSRVELLAPRGELGILIAKLIDFGQFHPSGRTALVQDMGLLLLGSRAQAIYSESGELLAKDSLNHEESPAEQVATREEFKAHSVESLIELLEDDLAEIRKWFPHFASYPEKTEIRSRLRAIREVSLNVFKDLHGLLVYPGLKHSVIMEGYIPTKSLEKFKQCVGVYLLSIEPVDRRQPQDPYVPSLLVNPRIVSLFEEITLEQGVPRYNEIDPTPIVAFVFPLFFGIMFGDVGHGTVLLALGWFLAHRTGYTYWGRLISVFGVSAALVGLARGLFFGIEFPDAISKLIPLPEAFRGAFTFAYVPLLLETSMIIGTFHLATAYAIAFLNQIRSGNYGEAFLSHLPTLLLYASIVPLGLALAGNGLHVSNILTSAAYTPVFDQLLGLGIPVSLAAKVSLPVVLGSFLTLIIGQPLRKYVSTRDLRKTVKALASGLIDGVTRPFEFLMNTISYVRLGVLLIAHTILGSLIANAIALGPLGVILAAILNLTIMGIEGLIVYIQDLRLHVYEWFTKFYFGLGTPFTPVLCGGKFSHVSWVWGDPSCFSDRRAVPRLHA